MRDMSFDPTAPGVYLEPERTSLSAILGFIFSLGGCCFGVTALLGLPLSIFALLTIGKSGGRLGGRGLAVAGLIIALLNLAAWGSCLGGAAFSWRTFESRTLDPTERFFISLQQNQFDGARANLASPAADATDEELIAFREAYRATLGDFVSRPRGFAEYISTFSRFGPFQNAFQPGGSAIPVMATFASGEALILIEMDQTTAQPVRLKVIDASLNEYTLPVQATAPRTDRNSAPPSIPSIPDQDPADPLDDPDLDMPTQDTP